MATILTFPVETSASRASYGGWGRLAEQHRRRPGLYNAAIGEVRQATPAALPIAHAIMPRLPRRLLCSQNLRTSTPAAYSSTLPIDLAITCPWVSFDGELHRNVLAFDLDHEDAMELAAALPPHIRPWVVLDPYSGRAHAFIFLASPVCMADGTSDKARGLANYAQRMMARALRATPLRHRALLKNPFGRVDAMIGRQLRRTPTPGVPAIWQAWNDSGSPLAWHTIAGADPVELRAIVAALADEYGEEEAEERTRVRFRRRRGDASAIGRNCALFDMVRFWAYAREERDGGVILAEAVRVNGTFAEPLPRAEVSATARSIAKFMRSRFSPRSGASSTRGRDSAIGAGLTIEGRQAVAGRVSAAARATTTDAKIAAAVDRLRDGAKRVTQAAVAIEAGVSLRTVKARWIGLTQPPVIVQDAVLSGSATASSPIQMEGGTPAAHDPLAGARPSLEPERDSHTEGVTRAGNDGLELAPLNLEQPAAGGDAGLAQLRQHHRQPLPRRGKDARLRRIGLRHQRGQVEKARAHLAGRRHGGVIVRRRVRHAPMLPLLSSHQRVIRHWCRRARDAPESIGTRSARLQRPARCPISAAGLADTREVPPWGPLKGARLAGNGAVEYQKCRARGPGHLPRAFLLSALWRAPPVPPAARACSRHPCGSTEAPPQSPTP